MTEPNNPEANNPEDGHEPEPGDEMNPWEHKKVPLDDVVISNSWALQSILEYLEEKEPGARDRVWQIYQDLQNQAELAQQEEGQDDNDQEDANSETKD